MQGTFDPATHRYFLDGVPIPSVTQVLTEVGFIDPQWYTDLGRDRGIAVHNATQYLDEGDLHWPSIHPMIRPYLEAYQKFKKDTGFVPDKIEQQVYNQDFRYAGTLDRTGTLHGQNILLDIKSGELPKWVGLQLAGYAHCLEEKLPRFALQLKGDGSYKLRESKDRNEFNLFLHCVSVTHWKQNLKGGPHANCT